MLAGLERCSVIKPFPMPPVFRYCPFCQTKLQPFSEGERLRLICPACGWIHYRNPTVGVAVILLRDPPDENKPPVILLGERRSTGWCIPCGHVEWDEAVEQAARREFKEETGLEVELAGIYAVLSNFHDPQHQTVGIWYAGHQTGGQLIAGGDLLRVEFFPLDRLPDLIFPTDREVTRRLQRTYLG
jgi:8-oxo-dGTP diphosphatase